MIHISAALCVEKVPPWRWLVCQVIREAMHYQINVMTNCMPRCRNRGFKQENGRGSFNNEQRGPRSSYNEPLAQDYEPATRGAAIGGRPPGSFDIFANNPGCELFHYAESSSSPRQASMTCMHLQFS